MSDSYVCSGAMMKCTMGTAPAKLTVLPTRTVNLCGQPQANISDHKTIVNLAPFGLCRSLAFPQTAAATAAALGTLTPTPCMHNTPMPWMGGKMDYLIKGQPALLKSCKCQCMWGGTISLITDGQMSTGGIDMNKKPKDVFESTEEKKAKEELVRIIKTEIESIFKDESEYSLAEGDGEKEELQKKEEASKLISVLRLTIEQIAPKTTIEGIPNTVNKIIDKTVDELLNNSHQAEERIENNELIRIEEKKRTGNTIIRVSRGGWKLASFIFDRLCLSNIIEQNTTFGKGRLGYDEKGREIVLRPGSKEGPVTIQVLQKTKNGNSKKTVFEIRFATPIEELIEDMPLVYKDGDLRIYQSTGGKEQAILDFKLLGLENDINETMMIDENGEKKPWMKIVEVTDENGNIIIFDPGDKNTFSSIKKLENGTTTIEIRYVSDKSGSN